MKSSFLPLVLLSALIASASTGSPPGDVVGKITVGYQGWFAAAGDGSPINAWWHWALRWSEIPSPTNNAIISWPDMRDYTTTFPTGFNNLGNGQPAHLFSSFSDQTIDVHFQWMKDYGIDTAALQRFNPLGGEGPIRDVMATKVRAAAERHGIKYYIMYDISDWINMQTTIRQDWTSKMQVHTSSPMYAFQNDKPVVAIWGFGFNDPQRPFAPEVCMEVLNWFKSQGLYVIGGVPTHWRRGVEDSRPGFLEVYNGFDMISPWMVGRIGSVADADHFYLNVNTPDQEHCDLLNIDYQPCVLPGNLTAHHRFHGDFMWRQFYNMKRIGVQGIYISMYDEYNEGNQIAKTAENESQIPVGSGFVTLDEDGVACSSDYYLRLTGDGGKMLKGDIPLTEIRPTPPVL